MARNDRTLQSLIIKFKAEGANELQSLRKELKQLATTTRSNDVAFVKAAKGVLDFGKRTVKSTANVKAQISALKTLRDQVSRTGSAYKSMSKDIRALELGQTKKGPTDKQLLSQFRGSKEQTISDQIDAQARTMKTLTIRSREYQEAVADLTRRNNSLNQSLREQTLIGRNLLQMDQKRSLTTTRYEMPDRRQGSEGIKALAKKQPFERLIHWLFETPAWTRANKMPDPGEASRYGGYKPRAIQTDRKFEYGIPGGPQGLPATTNALQFSLRKVQDELGDVTVGSSQYHRTLREIAEAQRAYDLALRQTNRNLRNAVNMLPVSTGVRNARWNLAGGRRVRGRVGSGYADFSADAEYGLGHDGRAIQKAIARRARDQAKRLGHTKQANTPFAVSGLYDQISGIGMSGIGANIDRMGKSWRTVRKDILAATQAGNGSISSLQAQRSAFEQLRAGVDPTSKSFRLLSKDIDIVDKKLQRLSSRKFSGANLARTSQAILGAGFFGGPAGFLGAGIGAGVNALRPGGDMQQGAITGGLIASQVLNPIAQGVGGATTYASDIEKAKIALRGITKDQENFDVAMAAATKATELYNVPQEVAIKGMTRLSAAVLGAGGNIHNAAEAFLNTTVAIKGTAGSADDVKSAITAMVQIYSKGKVSAEELSGQLGERFPAAVTKFAKANNISTQTLQKNLKDGTVGLDMLSKFVTSLGDEYAPLAEKIAASSEEAGARAQITMNKLKIAVGTTLKPIGAEFQEIGSELLLTLIPALKTLASVGAAAFRGLAAVLKPIAGQLDRIMDAVVLLAGGAGFVALGKSIGILVSGSAIPLFTKVLGKLRVAMKALRYEMMLNPWFAAGVAAAAVGLKIHKDRVGLQEFIQDVRDGVVSLKDASFELAEMNKVLEGGIEAKDDAQIVFWERFFGPIGSEERLKIIRDQLAKAIKDLQAGVGGEKVTFDPMDGDGESKKWEKLKEYIAELKGGAEAMEQVFINAFKGMEDALTNFVMTGKLKFKELARSVIADLARMIIRQMMFNVIAGLGKFNPLSWFKGKDTTLGNMGDTTTSGWTSTYAADGKVFGSNGIVPFARGGVVDSPTLFPFANGAGLMGEAGPEAIIPLKRGRDGKLGVAGGGGTNIAVNVDATGSSAEGDTARSRELGGLIGAAIQNELVKQKRPGGLLA